MFKGLPVRACRPHVGARAFGFCLAVVAVWLLSATTAAACTAPSSAELSGVYNAPFQSGSWYASETISPEEPRGSGVLHFAGDATVIGTYYGLTEVLSGPLEGTVTCAGDISQHVIYSGTVGDEQVSGILATYSGTTNGTTASGTWSASGESGTWSGAAVATHESEEES
jgi:hypothetical protein